MLLTSIALPFSVEAADLSKSRPSTSQSLKLPSALKNLAQEEKKETTVINNRQEITVQITSSKYSPNVILAKKDMPLTITLAADQYAGCGREVVFPGFSIKKIVPSGGFAVVELPALQEGTYQFHCSMNMIRGKIIVA